MGSFEGKIKERLIIIKCREKRMRIGKEKRIEKKKELWGKGSEKFKKIEEMWISLKKLEKDIEEMLIRNGNDMRNDGESWVIIEESESERIVDIDWVKMKLEEIGKDRIEGEEIVDINKVKMIEKENDEVSRIGKIERSELSKLKKKMLWLDIRRRKENLNKDNEGRDLKVDGGNVDIDKKIKEMEKSVENVLYKKLKKIDSYICRGERIIRKRKEEIRREEIEIEDLK